jgi:hypothetical protein
LGQVCRGATLKSILSSCSTSRVPFADRAGFACALAIIAITYAWPPVQAYAALTLFTPALLRETGVLRDGGERALQAARRAGFHAFTLLVIFFLISHALVRSGVIVEDISSATPILNESYLRGLLVGTYLVSYVMQLLGPRDGSFAILLGAAMLTLAPVPASLIGQRTSGFGTTGVVALLALAAVLTTAAFTLRHRPRAVGWALSGTFLAGALAVLILGRQSLPAEAKLSAIVQLGLVCGSTGFALLKWRSRVGSD